MKKWWTCRRTSGAIFPDLPRRQHVDAGIHDKDVVYIRIQPEVENGEIAAVRIDGEATLKRVYYNPGTLTLMPANPAYAPMIYTPAGEVHIEGKAVGWTHCRVKSDISLKFAKNNQ